MASTSTVAFAKSGFSSLLYHYGLATLCKASVVLFNVHAQ